VVFFGVFGRPELHSSAAGASPYPAETEFIFEASLVGSPHVRSSSVSPAFALAP
jgi:hypothetical protein